MKYIHACTGSVLSCTPQSYKVIHESLSEVWVIPQFNYVCEHFTIHNHDNWVQGVAWSPCGQFFASVSCDNEVHVYFVNKVSVYLFGVYYGHKSYVQSVSWSPCGKYIVSGASKVLVWKVFPAECVCTIRRTGKVQCVEWSLCGKYLTIATRDFGIYVWSVLKNTIAYPKWRYGCVWSISTSPCGRFVVSGGVRPYLVIWSLHVGKCVKIFKSYANVVRCVLWSPCGKYLASGSFDSTINIWSCENWKCVARLQVPNQWILCLTWSPCGKYLAVGSSDNRVTVWVKKSPTRWSCLDSFGTRWEMTQDLAWSPCGRHLICGGKSNRIVFINMTYIYAWNCTESSHNDTTLV